MNLAFFSSLLGATGQLINPTSFSEFFMDVGGQIGGFFAILFNAICGVLYIPVKWLLAFTDFLQYFIQKLIGLDYWLNNNVYSFGGAAKSDLLFSFLYSDTVQRVFTTMTVVFIVLLIIFTIYAIIRSEWQYITGEKFGDGSNSKMGVLRNAMKAIALVLIFPLTLTLGIISSNAILASLVKALNIDMASTFGGSLFLIGSKNANKYRLYAKSGQRAPISDTIKFYVNNGKVIRLGMTEQHDEFVDQYKDFNDYLKKVQGSGATLYTVNTMFDVNDFDSDFSGYIIGMDIEDQRYYYPVRCSTTENEKDVNSKQAMYYYLRNILQVDIMSQGNYFENGDGYQIYKAIGASKFSSNSNSRGYFTANFSGESNEALWRAIYNTWGYDSIYETTHEFETSLGYTVTSNSDDSLTSEGNVNTSLLNLMGFNSLVNAKILYNNNIISSYFDGGQFGLVQLQNEYYVMADIVDFMNNNDITLYMIDATSSQIDWAYDGYAPDDRWVGGIKKPDDPHSIGLITDDNFDNTIFADSLPFVVSYSDSVSDVEAGNILYTAKANVSDEFEGAKYLMCFKVVENGSTKYVPVVNRKEFKDPVTQNGYTFSSSYLSSTYRGVIVAKGVFAKKELFGADSNNGNTDALNGSPTYITSSAKMSADNGEVTVSKEIPYYYYMDVTGQMVQYAGYKDNGSGSVDLSQFIDKYTASIDEFSIDDSIDVTASRANLTRNTDIKLSDGAVGNTADYLKSLGSVYVPMQADNITLNADGITMESNFTGNLFTLKRGDDTITGSDIKTALQSANFSVKDSANRNHTLFCVDGTGEDDKLTFCVNYNGNYYFVDVNIDTASNNFSFGKVESNDLVLARNVTITASADTGKITIVESICNGSTLSTRNVNVSVADISDWQIKVKKGEEEKTAYYYNDEELGFDAFVVNFTDNAEGTYFLHFDISGGEISFQSKIHSLGTVDANGKDISFYQVRYANPGTDYTKVTTVAEKAENIVTTNELRVWFNITGDIFSRTYESSIVGSDLCIPVDGFKYKVEFSADGNTFRITKVSSNAKIVTEDGSEAKGFKSQNKTINNTLNIQREKMDGSFGNVELDYDLLKKLSIKIDYTQNTQDGAGSPQSATATYSGNGTSGQLEFQFAGLGYFYIGFDDNSLYAMEFNKNTEQYERAKYVNTALPCLTTSFSNSQSAGNRLLPSGSGSQSLQVSNLSLDSSVFSSTYLVQQIRGQSNLYEITNNGISQTINSEHVQNLVISLYFDTGNGRVGCTATYAGQNVSSDGITKSLFSFYYSGVSYYLVVQNTDATISVCSYTKDGDRFLADTNSNKVVAQSRVYTLYYDYTSKTQPSQVGEEIAQLSPADFSSSGSKDGYTLFTTVEKQTVKDGKYQFVNVYFDTHGTGRLVTLSADGNVSFADPVKKTQENINSYFYHSDEYTFQLYNYFTAYSGGGQTTITRVSANGDKDNAPLEDFTINEVKMGYYWCGSCEKVEDDNQFKWQFFNRLCFGIPIKDLKLDDIKITFDGTTAEYTGIWLNGYVEGDNTYDLRVYSIIKNSVKYYFLVKANYSDATITICDANGNPFTGTGKFLKEPKYNISVYEFSNTNGVVFDDSYVPEASSLKLNETVNASDFTYYKTTAGFSLFETTKGGNDNGIYDTKTEGFKKASLKIQSSNSLIRSTIDIDTSNGLSIQALGYGKYKDYLKVWTDKEMVVNPGLREYDLDSKKVDNAHALVDDDKWTFSILVDSNFSWAKESNSYGLYNGKNYVATIYKNIGQSIDGPDGISTDSIRLLYDNNTYYNVVSTNRYQSDDEIKAHYGAIENSMVTCFYRTNTGTNPFHLQFKILLLVNFRVKLSLGTYYMIRNAESAASFKISDGISFDYFFDAPDVGLSTFFVQSKISFWILLISSALIIKTLMTALWGVIKRFYEITLYFIAMPAVASTIPLDNGTKFKDSIQGPLIKKVLSTYGVILGINVFFILLSPVRSLSQVFTEEDIATSGTYFLKYLPIPASWLNDYVYILFVLVAFTMIETLPGVISNIIGAEDALAKGKETKQQVGESLSSAGDIVSGRSAMKAAGGALKTAANFIPGKELIAAPIRGVGKAIDKGIESFGRGFGEGYGSSGKGGGGEGEGEDGKDDGSSRTNDQNPDGGDGGEGGEGGGSGGGGKRKAVGEVTEQDGKMVDSEGNEVDENGYIIENEQTGGGDGGNGGGNGGGSVDENRVRAIVQEEIAKIPHDGGTGGGEGEEEGETEEGEANPENEQTGTPAPLTPMQAKQQELEKDIANREFIDENISMDRIAEVAANGGNFTDEERAGLERIRAQMGLSDFNITSPQEIANEVAAKYNKGNTTADELSRMAIDEENAIVAENGEAIDRGVRNEEDMKAISDNVSLDKLAEVAAGDGTFTAEDMQGIAAAAEHLQLDFSTLSEEEIAQALLDEYDTYKGAAESDRQTIAEGEQRHQANRVLQRQIRGQRQRMALGITDAELQAAMADPTKGPELEELEDEEHDSEGKELSDEDKKKVHEENEKRRKRNEERLTRDAQVKQTALMLVGTDDIVGDLAGFLDENEAGISDEERERRKGENAEIAKKNEATIARRNRAKEMQERLGLTDEEIQNPTMPQLETLLDENEQGIDDAEKARRHQENEAILARNNDAMTRYEQAKQVSLMMQNDASSDDLEDFVDEEHDENGNELSDEEKEARHKQNEAIAARNADRLAHPDDYKVLDENEEGITAEEKAKRHKANEENRKKIKERLGKYAEDGEEEGQEGEHKKTFKEKLKEGIKNLPAATGKRLLLGLQDLGSRAKELGGSVLKLVGLDNVFNTRNKDGSKRSLLNMIALSPFRLVTGLVKAVPNLPKNLVNVAAKTGKLAMGLDVLHLATGYTKATKERYKEFTGKVPRSMMVMTLKATGKGAAFLGKKIGEGASFLGKKALNTKAGKATVAFGKKVGEGASFIAKTTKRYTRVAADVLKFLTLPAENYGAEAKKHKQKLVKDIDEAAYRARIRSIPKKQKANEAKRADNAKTADNLRSQALALLAAHNIKVDPNATISEIQKQASKLTNGKDKDSLNKLVDQMNKTDRERVQLEQEAKRLEELLARSKETAKHLGDENYVPRRVRKMQALQAENAGDGTATVDGTTPYEVGRAEIIGDMGGLDGTASASVERQLSAMGYNNGAVSENATAISNSVRNLIKANLSGARTGEAGKAAAAAAREALKLHTATASGGADKAKVDELLSMVSDADKIDAIRRTLTPAELAKFNAQFKKNGSDLTGKALEKKYKEVLAQYDILGSASKDGAFNLSIGLKGASEVRMLSGNDKLYSQLVAGGNVSDANITAAVSKVGATERMKDFAGEHLAMSVDLSTSGAVAESVLEAAKKDEMIAGEAVRRLLESSDKGKEILARLEKEQGGKLDAVSLNQLASSDLGLASFMNEHRNDYNEQLLASAQKASMDGTFKLQAWDLLSSDEQKSEIEKTQARIEALAKSSILTGASGDEANNIIANLAKNIVSKDPNSNISKMILAELQKLPGFKNGKAKDIAKFASDKNNFAAISKALQGNAELFKKIERLGTNDTRLALSNLNISAQKVMSKATDEMKSVISKLFSEYAKEHGLKGQDGKELTFEAASRRQVEDFINSNRQAANIICGVTANKNYGQATPQTETEKQVEAELSAKVMDARALLNTFLNKATHTGEEKDIMDGLIRQLGSDALIKGELKAQVDAYNASSNSSWEDGAKLLAKLGVRPDLLKSFEASLTIGQRNDLIAAGSKDAALALSAADLKKLKAAGGDEHGSYYQAMLALGRQGKMNRTIAEEAEKKKAVDLAYDLEGDSIRAEDIRQFLSETQNSDPATIQALVDRYIEGMGLSGADADKQKDLMSMGLGQLDNVVADMVRKNHPEIAKTAAREYEKKHKGQSFADLDISRQNEEIKKAYLSSEESIPGGYSKDSKVLESAKQTDIEKLYLNSLMSSGILKTQLSADFVREDGRRIAKTISQNGLVDQIILAARERGVSVDEYIARHKNEFLVKPDAPEDKDKAVLAGISPQAFENLVKKISRDRTDPANDALVAAKKLLIEQNYYARKENGMTTPSDLPNLAGMTPDERREYNYRLSVINSQLRMNANSDILKNILQNTSFANEEYMLREMARMQGIKKADKMKPSEIKSLLSSATINDYFSKNKAFEAMMVQAGANNVYTALNGDNLARKKVQTVEGNTSLLADVLKELARSGKIKQQKGEDYKTFLERVKKEFMTDKGKFQTARLDEVMRAIKKLEANTKTGARSEFSKVLYKQVTQVVSYQANSTPRQQARFFDNDARTAIRTVHEAMDSRTSTVIRPLPIRPVATGGSQIVGNPRKQVMDDARRAIKEMEAQEFTRLKAEIARLSTNKLKGPEFEAEARKLLGRYYDRVYSSRDKFKEMLEGSLGSKSSSIQKNEVMRMLDEMFEKAARQADSVARLVPAKKLFHGDERFRGALTGKLKTSMGGADTSRVSSLVSKVSAQTSQLETTNIKELMAQNADYKAVVESYMAKLARSKELQDAITKSQSKLEELRSSKTPNKGQIKLEEENLRALITRLGLTQPVLDELAKKKSQFEHDYAAKNESRRTAGAGEAPVRHDMARGLYDPKGAPFDPKKLSERDRREFEKAYKDLGSKLESTIDRVTKLADKTRRADRDLRSRFTKLDNNLSKADLLTKELSAENRRLLALLKKTQNTQSEDARKLKKQIEENIANMKRIKQDVDTFSRQVQSYARRKPTRNAG